MADRAVLLEYVSCGDADGYGIQVSQETVAAEVGCSVATVKRSVRQLKAWGELVRGPGRAHVGFVPAYRFVMPRAGHSDPLRGRREQVTETHKAGHSDPPPIGDLRPASAAALAAAVREMQAATTTDELDAVWTAIEDRHPAVTLGPDRPAWAIELCEVMNRHSACL